MTGRTPWQRRYGFDPMTVAQLFRVPYRLVMGLHPRPLIHKGRKP
jgi:hypothetical protein